MLSKLRTKKALVLVGIIPLVTTLSACCPPGFVFEL